MRARLAGIGESLWLDRGVSFATGLVSNSAILMVAKLVAAALALATYWLLAQILEPADLGRFLTGLSLASLGGVIASLGYPSTMARFLARYSTEPKAPLRAAFVQSSARQALAASLVLAGLIIVLTPVVAPNWTSPLMIMALIIPAISLMRVNGALAIARHRPLIGYLPDLLGRAVLMAVALVVLAMVSAAGHELPAFVVPAVALGAAWIVCVYQAVRIASLHRGVKVDPESALAPRAQKRMRPVWLSASLPLLPSALAVALLADIVLLVAATTLPADDLAVLGVTLKIAFLVGFVTQVTVQVALPDLARSVNDHDTAGVWRQAVGIGLLNTGVIVSATLVVALIGGYVLAFFGEHYIAGAALLTWLCALQLLRVPAALAVQIMILSGRTLALTVTMMATLVTLAVGIPLFVHLAGLTGVAWAMGLAFAVMSVSSLAALSVSRRKPVVAA